MTTLHWAHVARIANIGTVLALDALLPWAGLYEGEDDGMRVVQAGEVRQLFSRRGDSEPALVASLQGDDLALARGAGEIPMELAAALAAIGLDLPGKGALLGVMDAERLHDRVSSVDHAWVLLRNLRLAGSPETSLVHDAATIMRFAREWCGLRSRLLESPERPDLEAEYTAMTRRATECLGLSALRKVKLLPDPRGAALDIEMVNRDYPMSVVGLNFNWRAGSLQSQSSDGCTGLAAARSLGVRPTQVSQDVLDALATAECHGRMVRIKDRLAPAPYARVKALLESLGGTWATSSQAFVFEDEPDAMITNVLLTRAVYTAKDYEFFETQPKQVAQVIELADIRPGMKILEPSAGRAALAMAAASIVGKENVRCYELMPANARHLKSLGFDVQGPQDFLAVEPTYQVDAAILNPPFSGGRDVAHILHALKFVRPGGTLTAIASTQWRTKDSAKYRDFRATLARLGATVRDIPPGAFRAVGTDVPTTLIALRVPMPVEGKATKATRITDAARAKRRCAAEAPSQLALFA